ncbi:hypothetical protein HG531_001969 [Fusarium graminearum]|nr:hypothetical protein HG531_001969 [Fusarium graminearum]
MAMSQSSRALGNSKSLTKAAARVGSDSAREVHLLELLVALLTSLLGLGGVNVGFLALLDLDTLSSTELVEDIRGSVLGKRSVVVLDSLLHVSLTLVGCTNAGVTLGNELEVGVDLTSLLDSLGAGLNGLVVVTLLEVSSSQVVEVSDILESVPGLGVVFDGLVKVALLVVLGTLGLELIGLLLLFLLLDSLLIQLGLGLGLGGLLGLGLLGGWWRIGHRRVLGFRGVGVDLTLAHLQIDTHQYTHNSQKTRVAEDLGGVGGVILD